MTTDSATVYGGVGLPPHPVPDHRKELRKFGLGFAAIVGGIFGGIAFWKGAVTAYTILFSLGGIAATFAIAWPPGLQPLFTLMMKIGAVLGFVNTRLLLGIVFYLLFLPFGLVWRLFAGDRLGRRVDPEAETYWNTRDPAESDSVRCERPF